MPADFPTIEVIALNRMGYGPAAGDLDRVRDMGFESYVDEQLNPDDAADWKVDEKLAEATLRIQYPAGENWDAVDEERPLEHLNTPVGDLWTSLTGREGGIAFQELIRPAQEVTAATIIRATHSKWQLREVMTEFWHNHFSVDVWSDFHIALGLPTYDRDIMRANALGNFRVMLEEVTKGMSMQYYLNNVDNRNSPANENFARELMELHTLGEDAYLNEEYDSWEQVPGAVDGAAEGFIDADVRELARVLTGWTTADGRRNPNQRFSWLPSTGEFLFFEDWHDHGAKRVLGEYFPGGQGMAEGLRVLDILAAHPATAKFVATKICRRLIADEPPEAIVEAAAEVFAANVDAPDQIAQVLRVILLSEEFTTTWGQKNKRPFEIVVSFLRALGADVEPGHVLFHLLDGAGQMPFGWPMPTGYPDKMAHWLNTNTMLSQWNLFYFLALNWVRTGKIDVASQVPWLNRHGEGVVEFLNQRLFGYRPNDQAVALFNDLARVIDQEIPYLRYYPQGGAFIVNYVAASMAMTPEFLSK